MKFTLAQLALETHRANPERPGYDELAHGLTGCIGLDTWPAKRLMLDDKFNLAVEKACLLPDADIAEALAGLTLRFPRLWIETVRPGWRLRIGCLFEQNANNITMLVAMENSVATWKEIGWRMPPQAHKIGDRALFSAPTSMRYKSNGPEWRGYDLSANADLSKALQIVDQHQRAELTPKLRTHALAEVRKQFSAADFLARAIVLLHSSRIVDPIVFEETPQQREDRRLDGARLRQGLKGKASLSVPCSMVPYDIAAVNRVSTARTPKQVSALVKIVTLAFGQSRPWINRKTGEPMLRKDGTAITTSPHERKIKVSENYFERQTRVTASRPVEVDVKDGTPVLTILPR